MGSIPIFGYYMRFFTRVFNGYAIILRTFVQYLGMIVTVLLTAALVVTPLWLLAQHSPGVYSVFTLGVCILLLVLLISIRIRNRVHRKGGKQFFISIAQKMAIALLIVLEIFGILFFRSQNGEWLVRGGCVLLFIVTIGLILHRRYGNR